MSLKIEFYASAKNSENEELELLDYCKSLRNTYCIYTINAHEVCSEFIARYFSKAEKLPPKLLENFIKTNYAGKDCKEAEQELYNGIYKANLMKIFQDSKSDYKFHVSNTCEKVRESLIDKIDKLKVEVEQQIEKPMMEVYALFSL